MWNRLGRIDVREYFFRLRCKGGRVCYIADCADVEIEKAYELSFVIAYLPVSYACRGHVPVGDGSRLCKGSKWK